MPPPKPKMPIEAALEIADAADLGDGAWMAMLEELTGLDAGVVSELLYENSQEKLST